MRPPGLQRSQRSVAKSPAWLVATSQSVSGATGPENKVQGLSVPRSTQGQVSHAGLSVAGGSGRQLLTESCRLTLAVDGAEAKHVINLRCFGLFPRQNFRSCFTEGVTLSHWAKLQQNRHAERAHAALLGSMMTDGVGVSLNVQPQHLSKAQRPIGVLSSNLGLQ